MTTSSTGRLSQWHRLVSGVRDYLSNHSNVFKAPSSITLPETASESKTADAVKALESYLTQLNDGVSLNVNSSKRYNNTTRGRLSMMTSSKKAQLFSQNPSSAPISRSSSPVVISPFISSKSNSISSESLNTIGSSLYNNSIMIPDTYDTMFTKDNNENSLTNVPDTSTKQGQSLPELVKTVNSYIPTSLSQMNLDFLRGSAKLITKDSNKKNQPLPKWAEKRRDIISKTSVDSRTRHLVQGVVIGNDSVTLRRLKDLNQHLKSFPHTKGTAVKCGGQGRMLRITSHTQDEHVKYEARTALSLMGYAGPVTGRGLRLLAIDGGGVRGLVALELVRKLEEETGQPVHDMFDMVCGVSTGAVLAVLLGAHRVPPIECEDLYRRLSERIFSQTALKGATGLVMKNSYYDSKEWDIILQEHMGEQPLLDTGLHSTGLNKMCLVACNASPVHTEPYLFRNYVLPYRVASHYSGTCHAKLWQAVRASAAAPGYFKEFQLGDKTLMDGGLLVNNPAAIAVHEARQLWPTEEFQCVVSLGTGRCQPMEHSDSKGINWGHKVRAVINSATDTEGVHTVLHDLLPANVYFRFNPHLSEEFGLDEIRPDRVATMMEETRLYARKNSAKFEQVAGALLKEKTPYHKLRNAVKEARLYYGWDQES